MPFSHLLGNEQIKAALLRMVNQQRLPQTLLFSGPDGVGKSRFALSLAALLMGPSHASQICAENHPDLHIFRPEGKAYLHPAETMRALIAEVGMPPFQAPCKVFLIHDAHQMWPASSNALLKTLEEPPLDTTLVLLTHEPELLLPTIVSRCRKIPFFPIPDPLIAEYAAQKWNKTPPEAQKLAFLAHGSLAKAHQLSSDLQTTSTLLLQQMLVLGPANYPRFLQLCTQLEEELSTDSEEEGTPVLAEQADALFETIALWYRDQHLLAQKTCPSLLHHPETLLRSAAPLHLPSLERVLEAIARSRLSIQRNVKRRVVLEELFFQLYTGQ